MATTMACLSVNTLEPTEVPMALETSLAPMPQAMNSPKTQARITSRSPCCAISSIRFLELDSGDRRHSACDQLVQLAADALGAVGEVADLFDDLVEEDHVYRVQLLFHLEQRETDRDL